MRLKIDLVGGAELSFEIQNTLDVSIYETSKEKIWGRNVYGKYIDLVNQNILRYGFQKEQPSKDVTSTALNSTRSNSEEPLSLIAKMIKYIDEII